MARRAALLTLLLLLLVSPLVGCTGGEDLTDNRKFGKVSGKVTVGGSPVNGDGLMVAFMPEGGQMGTNANVNADGTYACEAVVGVNKVNLVATIDSTGNYLDPATRNIDPKYLDEVETTLQVDVKEGGETTADFEVGM